MFREAARIIEQLFFAEGDGLSPKAMNIKA
jgi:hypothetical protein